MKSRNIIEVIFQNVFLLVIYIHYDISFRFLYKPFLDCTSTKSVKTISKTNQTTKEKLKITKLNQKNSLNTS